MKTLRHVSQLDQVIDRSLAWRKKELTGLRFAVDTASINEHAILCRAAVTLLYAHWEGFVKETGSAYLRLVASQKLPLSKLTGNFIAIGLWPVIYGVARSNKVSKHAALIERVSDGLDELRYTRWKGVVQTRSNLKAAVFIEILASLNLESAVYSTSMLLGVDKLVSLRNAVAHGQYLAILPEEYDTLHHDVLAILQVFRDQLGDAAASKKYLR